MNKVSDVTALAKMLIGVVVSLMLMAICYQLPFCIGVFGLCALAFGVMSYLYGKKIVADVRGTHEQPRHYFTAVDVLDTPGLPSAPLFTPVETDSDDSTSLFL